MRRRHASKSYQNELDQRRTGQSKEDRDRQILTSLRSSAEFHASIGREFPDRMKRRMTKLQKKADFDVKNELVPLD